jgi:hypothetical protein
MLIANSDGQKPIQIEILSPIFGVTYFCRRSRAASSGEALDTVERHTLDQGSIRD